MNEIPLYVGVYTDGLAETPEFWRELRARAPMLCKALEVDGFAIVSRGVWTEVRAIPGFGDSTEARMEALLEIPASELLRLNARRFDGLR